MHFFHTLHVSVYINNIKNFIRKKYISTNQKLWAWAYSEFVHFGLHFFLGAQGCSKSPGNHRFQCSRGGAGPRSTPPWVCSDGGVRTQYLWFKKESLEHQYFWLTAWVGNEICGFHGRTSLLPSLTLHL